MYVPFISVHLYALFCRSGFFSFVSGQFPVHRSLSCPLVNLWPVLFTVCRFSCPHKHVPESVYLLQFWKTVSRPKCRSVHRSIAFLSVYFFPAGPYPVLWSVSFSSFCFQLLSLLLVHSSISVCLFPCQSDCFLTVGLFPVYKSVSEPSVRFLSFS
jgi:hypothetical protein